jgi:hypothetical protein
MMVPPRMTMSCMEHAPAIDNQMIMHEPSGATQWPLPRPGSLTRL